MSTGRLFFVSPYIGHVKSDSEKASMKSRLNTLISVIDNSVNQTTVLIEDLFHHDEQNTQINGMMGEYIKMLLQIKEIYSG